MDEYRKNFTHEQSLAMYEFIKIMAHDDFMFLSDTEIQVKAETILQDIDSKCVLCGVYPAAIQTDRGRVCPKCKGYFRLQATLQPAPDSKE